MTIREAIEEDIPSIVALLKRSLGETLMPKSEAFWRWKHVHNPFGRSPVLLAVEGEQLIGIRAFMRWEWRRGERMYRAVRAVDTATHPDYQGKGIFKKLTLELVEQCRAEGVDFIFNTPNATSKQGYLKMGWQEAGRLKLFVRPRISLSRRTSDFESRFTFAPDALDAVYEASRVGVHSSVDGFLATNRSLDFLKWRYADNPNIRYFLVHNSSHSAGVIFRLKSSDVGTEFRICEVFQSEKVRPSEFRGLLFETVRASGASFITYAGVSLPLLAPALRIGPVVTFNPLSDMSNLLSEYWRPTLGDMEVF